jgi:hypothetical protein
MRDSCNPDHVVHLTVQDPTRWEDDDYMKVSLYSQKPVDLPPDLQAGSVLLLRNCAVSPSAAVQAVVDQRLATHYGPSSLTVQARQDQVGQVVRKLQCEDQMGMGNPSEVITWRTILSHRQAQAPARVSSAEHPRKAAHATGVRLVRRDGQACGGRSRQEQQREAHIDDV